MLIVLPVFAADIYRMLQDFIKKRKKYLYFVDPAVKFIIKDNKNLAGYYDSLIIYGPYCIIN